MTDNPYSASLTGPPKRLPDDVPGRLRHRSFRNRQFFAFSHWQIMKRLRSEVEEFVDNQIGVENVVSVSEYLGEIVVWYRTVKS